MSFFKYLSDEPEDYKEEDLPTQNLDEQESFSMRQSEKPDFIELVLDTGEQYHIPITWLIQQAREHKLQAPDWPQDGRLH